VFSELRSGCCGVCHMAASVGQLGFGRVWVVPWW
jgi:hypothetical protein